MAAVTGFIPEPPLLKPRSGFATSNFAVKAVFLAFSVLLLSLYPSRAPEFVGGSFLNEGWELLHLLLVGIAVSYGLFSRRNAGPDAEKAEASSTEVTVVNKAEASLSYLPRMNLRVATVFDEDDEEVVESELVVNETRTWNSRNSRVESAVVVAEKRSSIHDAKPLCLPVRSLRPQQVHRPTSADLTSRDAALEGFPPAPGVVPRQCSASAGHTDRAETDGDLNNVVPAYVETGKQQETATDVVLPSPIPWRSRPGRVEPGIKQGTATPPSPRHHNPRSPRPHDPGSPLPPNVNFGPSRTPSFRSTTVSNPPPPPAPPPYFHSTPPSVELGAKVVEDVPKRRSARSRTFSVPPPPPPPPLPPEAANSRSHKSVPRPPPPPPLPPAAATSRSHKFHFGPNGQHIRRGFTNELEDMSTSAVRGHAPNTWSVDVPEVAREQQQQVPRSPVEMESEPPRQRYSSPKGGKKKNRKEKKHPRRVIMESDESSESSATDDGEDNGVASSSATEDADADDNEVDKKADEFIAKFREQIRLQRIESIKKSAQQRQRARKSTT